MNKYAYFGNDDVSAAFLDLLPADRLPSLIITGMDRKSGRGRKIIESPPSLFAAKHGIETVKLDCKSFKDIIETLKNHEFDYFLIFSFGCYIPTYILNIPKIMSVNIHPSLLPELRGAAPINRAIINGINETGITFFKMISKMDAGPIIMQKSLNIEKNIISCDLKDKLISLAAEMFISFKWDEEISLYEQNDDELSYADKISKEDLIINCNDEAQRINNTINGLSEFGIKAKLDKWNVKLRQSKILETETNSDLCNIIIEDRKMIMNCRQGSLEILRIQETGKNIVTGREFVNVHQLKNGDKICVEYSD